MPELLTIILTVVDGAKPGVCVATREPEAIIGRRDDALLRLEEPGLAWEHAEIRQVDGKVLIVPLAAAGVAINGRDSSSPHPLFDGALLRFGPRCMVRCEVRDRQGKPHRSRRWPLYLSTAIFLSLAVVLKAVSDAPQSRPPAGPTAADVSVAFGVLTRTLETWEHDQTLPPSDFSGLFREAYRLEQAGSYSRAVAAWSRLWSSLRSLPAPASWGGRPLGEYYSGEASNFRRFVSVVRRQGAAGADSMPGAEKIDALFRFISRRIETCRRALDEMKGGAS